MSNFVNRSVVVFCKNKSKQALLKEVNAKRHWVNRSLWNIKYRNANELADILVQLKNDEAMFSSDPHG